MWLEPHEIALLETLNDGSALHELFRRLCPFFRGRHHTQEIMWREGVSKEGETAIDIVAYAAQISAQLGADTLHGNGNPAGAADEDPRFRHPDWEA